MTNNVNHHYEFIGGSSNRICPKCKNAVLYGYEHKKFKTIVEICAENCGYAKTYYGNESYSGVPENFFTED